MIIFKLWVGVCLIMGWFFTLLRLAAGFGIETFDLQSKSSSQLVDLLSGILLICIFSYLTYVGVQNFF
jgi:hypothetical protein